MSRKLLVLLLPLLLVTWLASPAYAQGPDGDAEVVAWQEYRTEKFIIVYAERVTAPGDENQQIPCACGVGEAERYAAFIDDLYADLAAVFEVQLATPITLHLFPTEQSYYRVNPLARRLTGVIAHAHNSRDEIAIALPRTVDLTEEELVNNVRHEVTHLFLSSLSDGKLTAGFQEGIAQYFEKPTDRSAADPALLRQAFEQNRLLSWDALDDPAQVYGDPQVAYPQTLSMVSFLVDRYGLETLLDFVRAASQEPGYRSALQGAYGASADELEAGWLTYLPEYFEGRWQINALYAYDLSRVSELVARGAYGDAQAELDEIVALLETTAQAETLARAEALLARARQGRAAGALADAARAALQAGDYALARDKGHAAIAAYEQVDFHERVPEIQTYVQQAERGGQALAQLDSGARLLEALRFSEAEERLYEATETLQALGDRAAAQRGLELLTDAAERQREFTRVLLVTGLATLFFTTLRRFLRRLKAHPLEVEFT